MSASFVIDRFPEVLHPHRRVREQGELGLEVEGVHSRVSDNPLINEIRQQVDRWRALPSSQWGVTPEIRVKSLVAVQLSTY
jgi:hypothetical protein